MRNFHQIEINPGHAVFWNTNGKARNALTSAYMDALIDFLDSASTDSKIGSVILAGEDNFFCSGGDLNFLRLCGSAPTSERYAFINKLHQMIRAIRNCPKPVISAVEGGAVGAGFSLALASDMIVAARDANFTLAYVSAGLVPDGGATHCVLKSLPRSTASKMAILAEPMPADRMHEMGVVSDLSAPGDAVLTAQKIADHIFVGPAQSIATIKQLLNSAEANDLDAQLNEECDAMAAALCRDEARVGISAVLEKRKPVWRST